MFVVLFCITYIVQGNQIIEIGETVNKAIQPLNENVQQEFYQFELSELKSHQDLVIVVKQQSGLGNPDIYISSSIKEPNINTADQICNSVGMDICIIENPQKGTYYLTVYCDSYCGYSLKIVYQSQLMMTNQDDLEFKFDHKSWTSVVIIETKNLSEDYPQIKPTLEIYVRVKNIKILQESFQSYLNNGKTTPTSQKFDYIGLDTFSGMQKFKIHNIESNSIFTLLVEGQEGLIIQIQTRTYGNMRYLQLGEKVEDVINKDEYQFYCIDLTQDASSILQGQTILNIQLLPYKGFAEMYVNLDSQPPILDQYKWKLTDKITDDLIITKADLLKYNLNANYAYVTIRALESNVTFELKSQIFDPNLMILELNKPTTSKLLKQSQIQYKFTITHNDKQTITVSLKNIKGDTDIILKQCQTLQNCVIQTDEIFSKDQKVNTNPGELFLFSDKPGNDIIIFDNIPTICQKQDNAYQCHYDVLIYTGKDNQEEELIYSILITAQGEATLLRENTPMKQYVGLGLNNYYIFKVEEYDQIIRMMIQVTPIQGWPKIFASKTNKKPDYEDKQGEQNVISYDLEKDSNPINGIYYITVNGQTACQYIITVYTFRNMEDESQIGKYPHQYILLLDGYPQEIRYQKNSDIQLFKVDLSAYYNPEQQQYYYSLDVKLRVIQGSFIIYGFDHPEIDKSKALVDGTDFLQISSKSQINSQYLYIRVEANPILSSDLLSYQIYYRIHNQPIELIIGNNYRGYINKDETQTFFLSYFKNEELLITKNVESYDQSILKTKIIVGNTDQEMIIQSYRLKIDQQEYDKCKTKATEIIKCQITIVVSTTQNTYFSLLITKESSIVFLYDGEPVIKSIEDKADHYTFFLSDQETGIQVYSLSGEIKIFLQIFYEQPQLDQFPTNNENSALQSQDDQNIIGSSIFISSEFLKSKNCQIFSCYIGVTCIKDSKYDSKGDYVIIRSSSYQTLLPSTLYYGKVEKLKITYFKISNVCQCSGLMVIVSNLSQGSLIVLASENEMPTIDTYQYSSNTNIGDYLIIPSNSKSNQKVDYYIGVQANENVKFSIQVNFGDLDFYILKKSVPISFFAQYNSTTFLSYQHNQDSEFTILLSQNQVIQYSSTIVQIYTYNDINMQADAIKKVQTDPLWIMSDHFLHIKNDYRYCTSCYYLIYVYNFYQENEISITISLDNESTQLFDNVEITNQIQSNSIQYYHYITQDSFYLNATIYEGQIQIFEEFYQKQENNKKPLLTLDIEQGLTNKSSKKNQTINREGLFPSKTIEIQKNQSQDIYRFKIISNLKINSIYKIECIQKKQAIELKFGEPQTISFNSTQTIPFYFIIPEREMNNYNEGFYTLDIETYGHAMTNIIKKTQHPNVKLTQDNFNNRNFQSEYHNYTDVEFKQQQTDQISHLEFSSNPGLYFLIITPKAHSSLPYTITLGDNFLNVLAPKLKRFASNKIGQSKFWEIHIYQPSNIFIQAQLCGGIMNIYGSNNLQSLQKGSYSEKLEFKQNKQIIGTISILQSGPYYLDTKATKSLIPQKDSLDYILSLNILQSSSIVPHDIFEPGNAGQFKAYYDGEFINVHFTTIQVLEQSSSEYKIQSFSYNFIYQLNNLTDQETPLYHCDSSISYPSLSYNQVANQKELNYQFQVGHNFQKITISILAKVKIRTKNFEELKLNYYYNTITINTDNLKLGPNQNGYMNIILFGIVLIILLLIYFVLQRNKRQNQQHNQPLNSQSPTQQQSIEVNQINYENLR